MCDPVTLTIAATAVAAGGQIMKGVGESQQYRYQANIDDQNAQLAAQQANDSNQNTNLEAQRRYRDASKVQGEQTAAMAANGLDLNFGSPVNVQQDSKMIANEDIAQIYKGGFERTRGFDINSWNYQSQAAAGRAKAKGAVMQGIFGAASTALGGASQVGKMGGFG